MRLIDYVKSRKHPVSFEEDADVRAMSFHFGHVYTVLVHGAIYGAPDLETLLAIMHDEYARTEGSWLPDVQFPTASMAGLTKAKGEIRVTPAPCSDLMPVPHEAVLAAAIEQVRVATTTYNLTGVWL